MDGTVHRGVREAAISYTNPFGGSPVQPADVSYKAYTATGNLALQWPLSNQTTSYPAARIMDVTASATSITITMPPADEVSDGMDSLVFNVGASTFTLLDASGGTIATVAPGVAKYVYITDNSDEAGTWQTFTFGTGTSAADASVLAGSGLKAISSTLNINSPVTELVTSYTVLTTDRAMLLNWNTGAGTLTLQAAATYGNGFEFYLINLGSGAITVDPNGAETINEAATLTVNPGESCIISTDGVSWYAIGQGRATTFAYSILNLSVAGSSNVTLTSAQAANPLMTFTGLLTGNINVVVPTAVNQWTVYNNTTGAFSLTVKTAAGTGVAITQGDRRILNCDGTNVVLSDDGTASVTASFPDGSASAPSITFTTAPSYGFFLATNPGVGVAAGGAVKTLVATGAVTDYVQKLGATGSASAPQYSFTSATQTGVYLASTAVLGLAVGGNDRLWLATGSADFKQTPVSNYADLLQTYTATGAVTLLGASGGLIHVVTMTATSTITLPVLTIVAGSEMTVEVQVVENGTGGYTPTFAADAGNSLVWTTATGQPTANTTASKETDYIFRRRGGATIWRGTQIWIDP